MLDRTYQLNVGGNMDFKNMLERERLESEKLSKTQAVTSQLDNGVEAGGPLLGRSAYFMKSPPVQYHDDDAHRMVEAFAAGI